MQCEREARDLRRALVPSRKKNQQADVAVQEVRHLLEMKFGNLVRAWRYALDPEMKGRITQLEFFTRVRKHIKKPVNIRKAWVGLTGHLFGDNRLWMEEWCPEDLKTLRRIRSLICDLCDNQVSEKALKKLWKHVKTMFSQDPQVLTSLSPEEFGRLCTELHFPLHRAGRIFYMMSRWSHLRAMPMSCLDLADFHFLLVGLGNGVKPADEPKALEDKSREEVVSEISICEQMLQRRMGATRITFRAPFTGQQIEQMAEKLLADTQLLLQRSLSGELKKYDLERVLGKYEQNVREIESLEIHVPDVAWVQQINLLKSVYYQCMRDMVIYLESP